LVAGDLNRIQNAPAAAGMAMDMAVSRAKKAEQFAQENFSEYHLYSLGRKTSVEDKETSRLVCCRQRRAGAEDFVVNGQNWYYHNQQNPGSPLKDNVMVFYKFKNEQKAGLGMPMPRGMCAFTRRIRRGTCCSLRRPDDHTPKDELVTIHIGNAFDCVSERKQTDYKRIDTHTWEMEFEITLRNHKDAPVTVEVNEPMAEIGRW